MKKSKVLSLLLALVMVFSMFPAISAADFTDVKANDWFAGAVDYVVSNNLMGGYNATSFGPNDNLSRAMVVQVLYNKEGQPAISAKHDFTDVPADQWFNNAVTWGTQKGVMGGYGNGKFGPNDNVTLEQIAVILWNYSGNPTFTGSAESLGAHSGWAANGLGWAAEKGILTNVPYQAVTEAATRAQTAQMLTNYLSDNSGIADGIAVTSVSLDLTSHTMGEGWTQSLTATVSPADATNTTITWSSSDPKIATVDQNGKVTGVSGGTATITAKSANGKTASCKVEIWHSHKLTNSTPATCTSAGSEIYTCAGCGHSYDKYLPALGHSINSSNVCTRCGMFEIPSLNLTSAEKKASDRVHYISKREFVFDEKSDKFTLRFMLTDSSEKTQLAAPALVEIKITNDNGATVYQAVRKVTSADFKNYAPSSGSTYLAAHLTIPRSDIKKGDSPDGKITYTVYSPGYFSFPEHSISISDDLPETPPITLSLPSLPQTLSDYDYSGDLNRTIKVTGITYSSERRYDGTATLHIFFTGEKVYDEKGPGQSSSITIGWKLYDSEGYVIEDGTHYGPSIKMGEKFRNSERTIYDLAPGAYRLEIMSTN